MTNDWEASYIALVTKAASDLKEAFSKYPYSQVNVWAVPSIPGRAGYVVCVNVRFDRVR